MNEFAEYLLIAGLLIALALVSIFATFLLAQVAELAKKAHLSIPPETLSTVLDHVKTWSARQAVELADRTASPVDDEVARAVVEQFGYEIRGVEGKVEIVKRE